jgi:cold shock CspA family protein
MEGCASNFDAVLDDFASRLSGAKFVAVDMELTGADLEHEPDTYVETAQERLSKLSRIAEEHVPIQIGFTIVSLEGEGAHLMCSSYNFYAFPWLGPENVGRSPKFACQLSALKFNARNNVDFNKWIRDGVPYISREDESKYLEHPASQTDADLSSKVGLLRLWKLLCAAQLPLVVHGPLDLFFLLACFEQAHLPRESPQEMARLIKRCSPCVFDTAYIHGFLGRFKRLGLSDFHGDAEAQLAAEVESGSAQACSFLRDGVTAAAFYRGDIHTAGYDSLLTAELFSYLIALSPDLLQECANRLYLYRSAEYLDLNSAAVNGDVAAGLFDMSRETPIVATLAMANDKETPKLISKAGYKYHWMDSWQLLVIAETTCADAMAELARLRFKSPGVAQWMPFHIWRLQARMVSVRSSDTSIAAADTPSISPACALGPNEMVKPEQRQRFLGVIKSFKQEQGFGFIECAETFPRFKRDVFLHHSQIGSCIVGQKVSFQLSTNQSGQPQAREVFVPGNEDATSFSPESTAEGESVFGPSILDDDDDTTRGSVVSESDQFGDSSIALAMQ